MPWGLTSVCHGGAAGRGVDHMSHFKFSLSWVMTGQNRPVIEF
jgi:hypothetical protein